ncbi:MAG: caspase family protein [Gammaproteobacteria bacterium]|nr:caspase family protein [Gammaproteobacteria bacterium]
MLVQLLPRSMARPDLASAAGVGRSHSDAGSRNPENDAVDMAAALQRLGFDVTTELDADPVELTEALRRFTRRSAGADASRSVRFV